MCLVECLLPTFKTCRVDFLMQILEEDKDVFECGECPHPPGLKAHWSEWAVKNAYPQLKHYPSLMTYLHTDSMDEGHYPDRAWFWAIVYKVVPKWFLNTPEQTFHNKKPKK